MAINERSKTIVVLGGSYGGARAAQVLAKQLPPGHRVILIDRNSHANHLYIFPRVTVVPGHEHKAFVPYTNAFHSNTPSSSPHNHLFLNAQIVHLSFNSVTLDRAFPEHGFRDRVVHFDYAVYALGSHLPAPIDPWAGDNSDYSDVGRSAMKDDAITTKRYRGTKTEALEWMKKRQRRLSKAQRVLVVGGGALGIQYATDIAHVYPNKEVTLLHSRRKLLPKFHSEMHDEIMKTMYDLNVRVILGERLDFSSLEEENVKGGQKTVETDHGRKIPFDLLLLCTGQIPNTSLLKSLSPNIVDPETKLAHVLRTMQLGVIPDREESGLNGSDSPESCPTTPVSCEDEPCLAYGRWFHPRPDQTPFAHIFVIGDAADAFGAIKAGHCAYYQGEVAARNIVRLIKGEHELEIYEPGAPSIKVTLGLDEAVYQVGDVIGRKVGEPVVETQSIWSFHGHHGVTEQEMFL